MANLSNGLSDIITDQSENQNNLPMSIDDYKIMMDNVHLQLLAEEIRKIYKNITKYKGVSKHLKDAIDLFSEESSNDRNNLLDFDMQISKRIEKNTFRQPIKCNLFKDKVVYEAVIIGIDENSFVLVKVGDKIYSVNIRNRIIIRAERLTTHTGGANSSSEYINTSNLSPVASSSSENIFMKAGSKDKIGIFETTKNSVNGYYSETTSIIEGLCE